MHWLAHQGRRWAVRRHEPPHGVVGRRCVQANLLVSRESSECLRSALGRVQVQWFVEYVFVRHQSHFLAVPDEVIAFAICFSPADREDRATARTDVPSGRGACVGLIARDDFVIHVEDEEPIGLLVHEHDVVLEPNEAVAADGMRHALEGLGKLLLRLVYKKRALVLFVKVVLLLVASHVDVF